MLTDILTAFCLVLIFEGILPFVSPDGYKRTVQSMLRLADGQLRLLGLSSMILGAVLLTIVR